MQNPSADALAKAWEQLAGNPINPDALAALVAAIKRLPTGRLATGAERRGKPPVIVSWQRVGGSTFVTFR
jgi:hypothetical protein